MTAQSAEAQTADAQTTAAQTTAAQTAPSDTHNRLANATPAARVRMATFRLARRLRAHRAIDSMTDGQLNVLSALWVHGNHTLGELAERERVSAPSMNRTVNGLEESGWVVRSADEADRRKVIITLTDAGHAVVDETVRQRDAWLDDAFSILTEHEREVLAEAAPIMRKLADI